MAGHQPPCRLVDVLRKNSPSALRRQAEQLATLYTDLPPEVLSSRYRQNSHLVPPKALRLLVQQEALRRHGVFAVYKPPFCPMKRSEARNHHRVSVESFITAALSSREVLPIVRETMDPRQIKVTVPYSLAKEASGPVLVSLRGDVPAQLQLSYQIFVAGHHKTEEKPTAVDPRLLYPLLSSQASASLSPDSCTHRVTATGYYAHHPVSLLEVEIAGPPCATPPALSAFVKQKLKTFVMGDPSALGKSAGVDALPSGFALQGDADFPRVFIHLRNTRLLVSGAAPSHGSGAAREGTLPDTTDGDPQFHCNNCFEPVFQRSRTHGLKGISLHIHDGSWSPISELLP
eukprot:gene8285-5804_t